MKTTWSLALVAGAGSALASAPPAYEPKSSAPPAYVASSSSEAGPISSSAVYSSSAAAPSGSNAPLPPCWTACFKSSGVSGEADLCGNDDVSKCVHDTCSAEEDKAYWTWYDSYCSATSSSSYVSVVPSSSSAAAVSSSAVPTPTCWTECFTSNGVTGEADLCGNDAVSACIHDTCCAEDDKSYWDWYNSYCSASTPPAGQPPVETSPAGGEPPVETSPAGGEPPVETYPAGGEPPAATYPAGGEPPVETSPSEGGPPAVVTNTVTNTKYVCPCDETPAPAGPTHTPGEVYTTLFTTEYETTCPGEGQEQTFSYGDWTSIYTSYSLTTTTEIITATITHPSEPTGAVPTGSAPNGGYPTWGSEGAPSASGPNGYPVPSGSASSPNGYPVPSGYASGSQAPYPYPSGSSTGSWAPTGTSPSQPTGTGCVPCAGQPGNNPEEWCGYDIHDNWYAVTPKTCKTVEYHWTITEETISPDGVPVPALIVNGQMPGPMIEANWGDEIIVHLTNGLPANGANGTSLHFHGIRQNGTNEMDGVSSITQCPIAPGHSMTYKWTATSYGSSWWHSHYALQTYTGIFGPMIIHGPAAAEYDDEQMIMLQDWNHIPVTTLYEPSQEVGNPASGPQTLDTGLINGMNLWEGQGQRFEMTVESGKSYRLRLVNSAIQSTFVFYVDQHELEVIAMDFVPITPYTTNMVVINIGQRYDVILKANQASGDYWMRSDNQQPCGQLKNLDIKAIVHYADGPGAEPTSQPYGYAPTCLDEPYEKLVPIVPWDAGAATTNIEETTVIGPYPGTNLFKWTLSGTTFFAEWDHPTLQQIYEDGTVPDTSGNLAIEVPNLHEWVYVIIQTPIPLPHPIHLHGHDFLVLAQGLGTYDSSVALNLKNPPRRDVAVMPADPTQGQPGYLVLAFQTSNPGVWLLHCHIGWHNAMGFALQIIENLEGIADTIKYGGQLEDTCSAWTDYAAAFNIVTSDSGV